jgi:sec-independent protein translocase protein TatA
MVVLQPVPLFPGLPGGPELLIVLLLQLLFYGAIVGLAAVGAAKLLGWRQDDDADERIAELERTVERLERDREN